MLKCSTTDCERAAQCAPTICVPATGHPAVFAKSLQAVLSLPLCVECCEKFDAKAQFTNKETRDVFRAMAKMVSSIPPDFKRAFVVKCWLDSPEYKELAAASAKSKH